MVVIVNAIQSSVRSTSHMQKWSSCAGRSPLLFNRLKETRDGYKGGIVSVYRGLCCGGHLYSLPSLYLHTNGGGSFVGSLYLHELTLIPAWMSKHTPSKVWDKFTCPFPNFNGATVEVWEWISLAMEGQLWCNTPIFWKQRSNHCLFHCFRATSFADIEHI